MDFVNVVKDNSVWIKLINAFGFEISDLKNYYNARHFENYSFDLLHSIFNGDMGDITYDNLPKIYQLEEYDHSQEWDCVNDFLMDFEDGIEFITDVKDDPDDYSSDGFRKAVVRFGDEYFAWFYYSSSYGNSGSKMDVFFNSLMKVNKKVEVIVTFE